MLDEGQMREKDFDRELPSMMQVQAKFPKSLIVTGCHVSSLMQAIVSGSRSHASLNSLEPS